MNAPDDSPFPTLTEAEEKAKRQYTKKLMLVHAELSRALMGIPVSSTLGARTMLFVAEQQNTCKCGECVPMSDRAMDALRDFALVVEASEEAESQLRGIGPMKVGDA